MEPSSDNDSLALALLAWQEEPLQGLFESQSAVCEACGLVMYFVFLRSAMNAFIDSQLSSMVFVSP